MSFLASPAIRAQALTLFRAGEAGSRFDTGSQQGGNATAKTFGTVGTINYRLADGLALRSITSVDVVRRDVLADGDGTPYDLITSLQPLDEEFYSEELQLIGSHGPLSYTAGLYGSRENGRQRQIQTTLPTINPNNPTITDPDVRNSSLAVFGQAEWVIADRFVLTGGLRYTWEGRDVTYRSRTGGSTSPGTPIPVLGPPPARKLREAFR